ncbi:DNA helicase/exodeoxyribonuclease V gamma subunit [Arcticibacter tournemirensis]|uniref:RecBCD enzyme subunit RecC n=1 Tax=Arcticibacter tournemirensis TaxID=699437 RepID=A0A5M9HEX8_9SPHI|nr:exodeoxyribonuclease V subunit gamma [Arcticibacter tournemirensis]KAA8485350.1 exodeoxyribonuclease V subunit gamma [Arcticibacter tournemirensis]TQM50363.1 DNA helicase/exodeoxyribonuclease V gamma subunit [Arcticibacter tournemirensis]
MALYLQVSNSLSQLAKKLCSDLQAQGNQVFQPYYIVTQTEGMNNWLKLQLADSMGIAANYRFLRPNDIVFKIYQLLGGRYSQSLSPENLSWVFYKLLNDKEFKERFGNIAAYFGEGSDKEVKRLALAEKVADLLDQYQIYRPEMVQEWNRSSIADVKDDEWQKFLWIRAKELTKDRLPDRTLMGQFILQALQQGDRIDDLKRGMPAVHIFGLSVITSYHLQLFSELSRYIDFSFHILNPAPSEYWFEDRSEKQMLFLKKKGLVNADEPVPGNPLLTSWGRLIQNTFSLFFQNDALINAYDEVGIEEPGDKTLLQCIQQDIFYNRSNADRRLISPDHIRDGSVTINACYTAAREVEALYNYLVHLIDKHGEVLSARDIVVMVSDIDAYAPYIRAVFNNAPYSFHYTIADESFAANDSLSNALQSVLRMNRQTFKAEEVLQLLDSGYIRKRFAISDLNLIRKAVDRANIRFGMEGDKDDDTIYVSWKYGIERIIYGICMSGDEEFKDEDGTGFYPLELTEGHASAELIRFCHFVQVLMDSVKERERSRSVSEWVGYVESVLYDLVSEPGEDAGEDYDILLKQLENYNALNELITENISYEVFSHNFLQSISSATRSSSFATGGVTFCSLIPMRSIPFRVVALLGLNFDKFPRKENPSNFNLMEREKRKGDRNIKENDKHLFLETILSARDYLYISYIGQSTKDNTVLPPSALVDELVDYIEAGVAAEEHVPIVIRQPLHSFSRKYNLADDRLYNYLNYKQGNGETDVQGERKDPPAFDPEVVSLDALVNFFKNPVKGYYNDVLGIYFNNDEVLLSDTELFELDGLSKWSLKQDLLLLPPEDIEVLKDKLVKKGALPLKNMADIALRDVEAEVSAIRDLFNECTGGMPGRSLQVEVNVGDVLLKGRVNRIFGDRMICISWSKKESKYLLEAYLRYLAVRASGALVDLYFISTKEGRVFEASAISGSDALSRLKELLDLYKQGHKDMLAFFPDFEIEPSKLADLDEAVFQSIADKKLNSYPFPCTDAYVMREAGNGFYKREGVFEEYKMAAEMLLLPLADIFPGYYQN